MPTCLSPGRQFPFKGISAVSPAAGLDYHSDHTLIPTGLLTGENSLGVFLNDTLTFSSLFCSTGFLRTYAFLPQDHSRQATLCTVSAAHRF